MHFICFPITNTGIQLSAFFAHTINTGTNTFSSVVHKKSKVVLISYLPLHFPQQFWRPEIESATVTWGRCRPPPHPHAPLCYDPSHQPPGCPSRHPLSGHACRQDNGWLSLDIQRRVNREGCIRVKRKLNFIFKLVFILKCSSAVHVCLRFLSKHVCKWAHCV